MLFVEAELALATIPQEAFEFVTIIRGSGIMLK